MRFLLRIVIVLGLLSMVLATPVVYGGDPFSLSGNWNFRQNGGDEVETAESFNQSYNLNFIKQLSAAMNLSAATRYNENQLSDGDDSSSINPSASFDLRNDLFSLNLSGSDSRLKSDGSPDFLNRTWGANLYSQLEKWPSLRLSYNQSSFQDDQSIHEQNTESSNLGASIEYSLSSFDMLYDFSMGTSDDLVADSTSDTTNHYAQLKYSESFFRNRLSVAATQQYSSNETETDTAVGPDGVFVAPVTVLAGFSAIDNTPLTGPLADNDALRDGDRTTSAVIWSGQNNEDLNVGIQVNFQLVSRLTIFFDQLIPVGEQSKLSWELYQSSDNNNWERVNQVPTVALATVTTRTRATIDVPVQLSARYIKVVIRANVDLIDPVGITEIEAGELRTTDASRVVTTSKFVSHQTQLSVSYRPAPGWATGYSMRRVLNLPDAGPENTQITHSVNASYSPANPYFSMALGASENSDDTEGSEETRSRSYSLAVNSSPLPTLDLSLGYTRTHSYEGGDETSQSDQVNGTATAELYPDLTVGFSPSWTRSRSLDTGAQTTTYGFILTSNARLNPRTNLTANFNYSKASLDSAETETETETETDEGASKQYGATLSYRPSDVLLVSTSLQRDEDSDSTSLSGNMAWLFTRSVQANLGASFDLGEGDSEQYNASVHWSISRNLSMQGSGGYQIAATGDTWNMGVSLNANY
ncbi:MAG: hypothetical protein A2X84_03035 [Desulfuromonadaceae bacterium GWC2_58_13]|nr:MAG: hypothetical protein A2X84_03035 [Desulfuromonadaceae bacterium GWC2_58_13]